jgi:hypothetical protein
MSEYVRKEELKKFFESIEITVAGRSRAEAISEVLQAIYNGVMELPTTEAEPVIRCEQCAHYTTFPIGSYCMRFREIVEQPSDYCSKAELKETNNDQID